MPTDRGGLRYSIFLADKFTKNSQKFRSEMRKNRTAFGLFRASMAKSRTDAKKLRTEIGKVDKALGKLEAARTRAAQAGSAASQQDLSAARRVQAVAKQRTTQELERAKILKQMRADERAQARSRTKTTASQAKGLRRNEALRRRNLRTQQAITRSTKQTAGAANRVAFTFRRLFGILAAFQAARAVAGGFTGLIRGAISFNREVEDSQISLASLFITTGQIRDAQGELVEGAAAFALAQGEARRQTKLLRQDSLKTVATFGELLKAFQAGVGPGLAAGLQLDEIREITIRVSQAAAALALPQNQLIEEIRSLLRGTIQARTTLVASVLGITNEDIKRTKEAGTLFFFLQTRLEGFKFAAIETERTVTGLFARIRDAFLFTGGTAALPFFEQLRHILIDFFEIIVDIKRDARGAIESILPSPEVVEILQGLFDGLALAIAKMRGGLQNLRLDEVQNVAGGLGTAFAVAADVFIGGIQGIISALSDAVRLAKAVANALGIDFDTGTLQDVFFIIAKISTFLVLAFTTTGLLGAAFGLLVAPIKLVGTLIKGIFLSAQGLAKVATKIGGSFFLLAAIMIAAGLAFKSFVDKVAGFSVKFTTFFKVLKDAVVNTFMLIAAFFKNIFLQIESFLFTSIARALQFVLTKVSEAATKAASAIAAIAPVTARQLDSVAHGLLLTIDDLDTAVKKSEAAAKTAAAGVEQARKRLGRDFVIAIDEDETADTLVQSLEGVIQKIKDTLGGALTGGLFGEGKDLGIDFAFLRKALADAIAGGAEDGGAQVEPKLELEFTKVGKFLNQIIFNFEQGLSILRTAITQFANFIAQALVDAFDPTKDVDIVERFARLMQSIAQTIIQMLVQVAIARALLGFGLGVQSGSFGGIFGSAQAPGAAEGGPIPDSPAPSHVRPSGLDPTDKVPIWAAKGEFMQRASAVKKYGLDVMDKINRGLINPGALRALAGLGGIRKMKNLNNAGPGFATGGALAGARAAAAAQPVAAAGPASAAPPTTLFFGEREMERALGAGAGKAMLRFLRENQFQPNS